MFVIANRTDNAINVEFIFSAESGPRVFREILESDKIEYVKPAPRLIEHTEYFKTGFFSNATKRQFYYKSEQANLAYLPKRILIRIPIAMVLDLGRIADELLNLDNQINNMNADSEDSLQRDLSEIVVRTLYMTYTVKKKRITKLFPKVAERLYEWSITY